MPIDEQQLLAWPFAPAIRHYEAADAARFARAFGAGLPGPLQAADEPFLDGSQALPMIAAALADGEFWQRDPAAGIDWRSIVHAEEGITVHRPLEPAATVVLTQKVAALFDRGPGKGAVMQQEQLLSTPDGAPLVTIDVTTILKGDGGFGGKPYAPIRMQIPQDRAPDAALEVRTPKDDEAAIFRLSRELAVAADLGPGRSMMRGLGCFGLVGRAVLELACAGRPERLKRMAVRYTGPMLTDETMLVELWHTEPGRAMFRMTAVERQAAVLNHCVLEFIP